MNDDKTNALTDLAYYNGARYALIALGGGMDRKALDAELEARVAPARRWLAENRGSTAQRKQAGAVSHSPALSIPEPGRNLPNNPGFHSAKEKS